MSHPTLPLRRSQEPIVAPCLSPHDRVRCKQLQSQYSEWLSSVSDWENSLFLTLTFKKQLHRPDRAWEAAEIFYDKLSYQWAKANGKANKWKRTARPLQVTCLERGSNFTERFHFHTLTDKIAEKVPYSLIQDCWTSVDPRLCGHVDIERPRASKRVLGYISKWAGYIVKDGDVRLYPAMSTLQRGSC